MTIVNYSIHNKFVNLLWAFFVMKQRTILNLHKKRLQGRIEGKRGCKMTAKEYLRSIKYLDDAINAKQAELDRLRRDAENLKGITYSSDKVQSNTVSDTMQVVCKIVDLNNEINDEIDRLVDLKAEAHSKIQRVYNPKFISLLTDLYINGETLEEKAEKLDKSYMTICRWHGQALQIFRKENNML